VQERGGLPQLLAKVLLEQPGHEDGVTLVDIRCKCHENSTFDAQTLILINEECEIHRISWHRPMVKHADGSVSPALPLKKAQ